MTGGPVTLVASENALAYRATRGGDGDSDVLVSASKQSFEEVRFQMLILKRNSDLI